jgi:hypothetical protein
MGCVSREAAMSSLFKRRRFPIEIILLCVRWYCKYGISYRDLAEMMQERGVNVDASPIFRTGAALCARDHETDSTYRGIDLAPGGQAVLFYRALRHGMNTPLRSGYCEERCPHLVHTSL